MDIIERLARQAGYSERIGMWRDDKFRTFAALVLEEACAAVGRKWHTSVDECVAEIRALKPSSRYTTINRDVV